MPARFARSRNSATSRTIGAARMLSRQRKLTLQLHLVVQPAEDVDVVPALFVVAARRIVVDADDVAEILVELGIEIRLEDVVEDRLLALFLRLERLRIVEHFAVAVAEDVRRIPALDAEQPRLQPGRDDRLDQRLPGLQVLAGDRRAGLSTPARSAPARRRSGWAPRSRTGCPP